MIHQEFYKFVSKSELLELAKNNETPGYIYVRKILLNQIQRLKQATHGRFDLHYALKANPNIDMLRTMSEQGIGADVASEGELTSALKAGFSPDRIEFSGPGKRDEELKLAIENGIASINIENLSEIDKILGICAILNTTANIGIRLNPTIKEERSGMRMAGDTQFGLTVTDAIKALDRIEKEQSILKFTGFHAHLASQELDAENLVKKYSTVIDNVMDLMKGRDLLLKKINFGGGLGIKYFSNQSDLDLDLYTEKLEELFETKKVKSFLTDTKFIIEPGRFLMGECGVFITRVLYKKQAKKKVFLIADGGLNANYVLAGGMGQVIRRNFELDLLPDDEKHLGESYCFDLAGPLCTPQDIIATNVETDLDIGEGDYVVFFNCGAYGPTASPLYFLSQKKPVEIII